MNTVNLKGVARWAKIRKAVPVYTPNGDDSKGYEYTIDVILDDESWLKVRKAGIQLKERAAKDDGARFLTFHLKTEEFNYAKDKMETNAAPEVFLWDAQSQTYNKWPEGAVGNGSDVVVVIEVYKTRVGMAHRLLRVFVDKLVEFEGRDEAPTPDTAKLPF